MNVTHCPVRITAYVLISLMGSTVSVHRALMVKPAMTISMSAEVNHA